MHDQTNTHTIVAEQISKDEKYFYTECSCRAVTGRPIESKEDLELLKAQHLETPKDRF